MPQLNVPAGANARALPALDLLQLIAAAGDLIGRAPDGRAFLLIEVDGPTFDLLCEAGAEREDLEDEEDDDDQAEPSLAELHPLDRPELRRRAA